MSRYRCTTPKCVDFEKVVSIYKSKHVWNEKTQRLECEEALCPHCNNYKEAIREKGPFNAYFKAENAKNYNNKKIKKYDYDVEAARSTTVNKSTGAL